jgi:ankyrin repeat protein
VKFLLDQFDSRPKAEKQAYLDAANEYGNTGLHWAALGGHLDTVKLLMENGASPALANDKNYVPLDLASFNDKLDVVDYFLAKSEAMETQNDAGLADSAGNVSLEDGGDDAHDAAGETEGP